MKPTLRSQHPARSISENLYSATPVVPLKSLFSLLVERLSRRWKWVVSFNVSP